MATRMWISKGHENMIFRLESLKSRKNYKNRISGISELNFSSSNGAFDVFVRVIHWVIWGGSRRLTPNSSYFKEGGLVGGSYTHAAF